jgi:hypothetical protein
VAGDERLERLFVTGAQERDGAAVFKGGIAHLFPDASERPWSAGRRAVSRA